MARLPKRPCSYPGCGVLSATGRCERHPQKPWVKTNEAPRIRGRRLQAVRKRILEREPLCRQCGTRGVLRAATEIDHVIPLSKGGADVDANRQPLCTQCNADKNHVERV